MTHPKFVSVDGEIVPYETATVHFLSPAAKYGSSVFEGIRGYWNEDKSEYFVFRLREHVCRLRESMKVMRFSEDYDENYLCRVVLDTIRANNIKADSHIRLSALLCGEGLYDVGGPVSLMCAALPGPSKTLEEKTLSVGVTSWRRIHDSAIPPRIKCGANYQNSRLGLMDVKAGGYDKVLFLTPAGNVAEGAGECIFIVRGGCLVTPSVTSGILESITRETILEIARQDLGLPIAEREMDRTEIYVAEEAFFAGTMAEICPVTSLDGIAVGSGAVGNVTSDLWSRLESLCRGTVDSRAEWRTPVYG